MRRVLSMLAVSISLCGVASIANAEDDPFSFAASFGVGQRLDDSGDKYFDPDGDRPWVLQPSVAATYAANPNTAVWLGVAGFIDPADTSFSDNGNNEIDITAGATFTLNNGVSITPELGFWAAGEDLTGVGAAVVPAVTVARSFDLSPEGLSVTPALRAEYIHTLDPDGDGARMYPQATLAYDAFELFGKPVTTSVRGGLAVAVNEPFGLDSGVGLFAEPSVRLGFTDNATLFVLYKVTTPVGGMEDRDTGHMAKVGIELTF